VTRSSLEPQLTVGGSITGQAQRDERRERQSGRGPLVSNFTGAKKTLLTFTGGPWGLVGGAPMAQSRSYTGALAIRCRSERHHDDAPHAQTGTLVTNGNTVTVNGLVDSTGATRAPSISTAHPQRLDGRRHARHERIAPTAAQPSGWRAAGVVDDGRELRRGHDQGGRRAPTRRTRARRSRCPRTLLPGRS